MEPLLSIRIGSLLTHLSQKAQPLHDPVTINILSKCKDVPIKYVTSSDPAAIKNASSILSPLKGDSKLEQIHAGKRVLYISPALEGLVDDFEMPDKRLNCPEFDRFKFSFNGCYYNCDWCFLKATYGARQNYITIRVEYDKMKKMLLKRLSSSSKPVMFDTGELADSLALEHLTGAAREFIPWFAEQENGYMYMLTKSTNVDDLLKLKHNNHTILGWSLNSPLIAMTYEVDTPILSERIAAAKKVQDAGYPLRLRLDPIIPIPSWKYQYTVAINQIFKDLKPERITLGTLRLEEAFYKNRDNLFQNTKVKELANTLVPMLDKDANGSIGKYSFPKDQRIELFQFAIEEIRKHSKCDIALCKETKDVWEAVGLDLKECKCICQYDSADMTKTKPEAIVMTTDKTKKTTKAKSKTKANKKTKNNNDVVEVTFVEKPVEAIDYETKTLYHIPVKHLNPDPFQPRKSIEEEQLKELTASIEKHGVLQPILFRKDNAGNLIIISGERRFQASLLAKEETIPAIYFSEKTSEIALIENMLRVDLTAIEEAEGLLRLKTEEDYTNKQLAAVFGKAESTVSEILKLNEISIKLRNKYRTNKQISRRTLLEVAKAPAGEMDKLLKKLAKKELKRDEVRAERNKTTRGADIVCTTMSKTLLNKLPELNLDSLDATKKDELTKTLEDTLNALANLLGFQVNRA